VGEWVVSLRCSAESEGPSVIRRPRHSPPDDEAGDDKAHGNASVGPPPACCAASSTRRWARRRYRCGGLWLGMALAMAMAVAVDEQRAVRPPNSGAPSDPVRVLLSRAGGSRYDRRPPGMLPSYLPLQISRPLAGHRPWPGVVAQLAFRLLVTGTPCRGALVGD
jgi:hypothetical protein